MRLVFLGDSLTEYFDWQGRFPSHRVTNLGIAGEPIGGLLARLDRIRSSVHDPDLIFIMTGINDIAMDNYAVLGEYRRILRELSSWSDRATVVVQSILPVLLPWVEKGSIQKINEELRHAAAELGAEYLDLHLLFLDRGEEGVADYLLDDGVHLSGKGYEVWANAVEELIARIEVRK